MKLCLISLMYMCLHIESYAKSCRNYIDLCDDIEDVTHLKQNAADYKIVNSNFTSNPREVVKNFFSAWNEDVQKTFIFKQNAKYYVDYFDTKIKKFTKMYSDNMQRWSIDKLRKIQDNMQVSDIGKIGKAGIVIRNTQCKCMPTDAQFFENIYTPGGSYPFDENRRAVLRIGFPVFISHLSDNKEWALVYSGVCSGWVKFADIAYVDNNFIEKYTKLRLGVFIEDGIPIKSKNSFHESSNIGMLLPKIGAQALIPTKMSNNFASLILSEDNFNANVFVDFPYKFNQYNAHFIMNKLLGTHYAWGGNIYGGRDCSLTVKDFMCVFGRYLPRHSLDQIESQPDVIDVTNAVDKEAEINKLCTPFQSIVYMPGHIMLYVGTDKYNRPVFFHNVASLCHFDGLGRFFVGKTILSHGDDTKKLYPKEKTLLQKITKVSVVNKQIKKSLQVL